MKKLILTTIAILLALSSQAQFLLDTIPNSSSPIVWRATINESFNTIEDTINAHTLKMNSAKVGNASAPPWFDGSSDGGQILYFYGNNGFSTGLQGGAPTAPRLWRLPIAAPPSAGDSAYILVDEYGNMILRDYIAPGGGTGTISGDYTGGAYIDVTNSVISLDTASLFTDGEAGISLADSTGYAVGNYVTHTQLSNVAVSGGFQRLSFIVGTTENAPSAGDSVITHGAFMNSYVDVFRTGGAPNELIKVPNDTQAFTLSDSVITFHDEPFMSANRFEFHIYPTSSVQNIALRDTTPTGDQTHPIMLSAEIGTYNDSIIVALFSENLQQDSIPIETMFGINQNGSGIGITSLDINYDTLFIALDNKAVITDPVAMTYTNTFEHPQLQDSANNIVATFADSTVINNISSGLDTLGTEMVYNGSFTSGDNWTFDALTACSIAGGGALYDFSDGNGELKQYPLVADFETEETYRVEFDLDIDITDEEYAWIGFYDVSGATTFKAPSYFGADGHYVVRFTTPAIITDNGLQITFSAFAGADVTLDNLTVKKVL